MVICSFSWFYMVNFPSSCTHTPDFIMVAYKFVASENDMIYFLSELFSHQKWTDNCSKSNLTDTIRWIRCIYLFHLFTQSRWGWLTSGLYEGQNKGFSKCKSGAYLQSNLAPRHVCGCPWLAYTMTWDSIGINIGLWLCVSGNRSVKSITLSNHTMPYCLGRQNHNCGQEA